VVAGEEFSMQFVCTNPDPLLCPYYFMVIFHGPTRQTVLPDAFEAVNWTNKFPIEGAVITAKWTIHDPGHYLLYAYPSDFGHCQRWITDAFPWFTATVQGCPFEVNVKPSDPSNSDNFLEGYGTCAAEQIYHGRYLTTDSTISSPEFSAMYKDTGRSYIYAPYYCKIPHRTVPEAVRLIPSAKHFLYMGDSTTRSHFCTEIWEDLHGSVENTMCRYAEDNLDTNKFTHALIGEEPRSINFSFIWNPDWRYFEERNIETILNLNPPPTHVVFNVGLHVPLSGLLTFGRWIANESEEGLTQIFVNFLEFMKAHFSHSVEHIILKTTTAVVQVSDRLHCFLQLIHRQ
jgi:hypothetical protein